MTELDRDTRLLIADLLLGAAEGAFLVLVTTVDADGAKLGFAAGMLLALLLYLAYAASIKGA